MSETEVSMSRIAKLPPFWRHEPAIWFFQVEAAFGIARITIDETKYQYLLSNLDTAVLPFVSDIIRNPPDTEKYATLKKRILEAFAESKDSKIRKLLKNQLIGDQKPSHFLQHMRNLADNQCEDTILRSLFLEQLPPQVSAILSASKEEDLTQLAILADRVWDIQRPALVGVVDKSTSDSLHFDLIQRVEALSTRLDNYLTGKGKQSGSTNSNYGRSRSKSPWQQKHKESNSSNNDSRNSNSKENNKMCFYHYRFGKKARNCIQPCTWTLNISNSGN